MDSDDMQETFSKFYNEKSIRVGWGTEGRERKEGGQNRQEDVV